MVDDVAVRGEQPVRQPVLPHELPDVLDRIELRRLSGQRDDGDVLGHVELGRGVPACLVHEQHGVRARGHGLRNLDEVEVHRLGVAKGQDEAGGLAIRRADRAEDGGGFRALVVRG